MHSNKVPKGEFGSLLLCYIETHDQYIVNASKKIDLHPYVISKHIRMKLRPRYSSMAQYAKYLYMPLGVIANMIDKDWRELHDDL